MSASFWVTPAWMCPIVLSSGLHTYASCRQPHPFLDSCEFYVSSIQFHAAALTPQMIVGIGSPDDGAAPANDTSR